MQACFAAKRGTNSLGHVAVGIQVNPCRVADLYTKGTRPPPIFPFAAKRLPHMTPAGLLWECADCSTHPRKD